MQAWIVFITLLFFSSSIDAKRCQEPVSPYPYHEEEVSFKNPADGVILSGTLTLPKTEGSFPIALFIVGHGPNDRDETLYGHKPFLVLADHLTRQGVGCLRVDKRGVGKSTGNYETATLKEFAGDALAGVEYLKTRTDLFASKIGLIGHSEGGFVASMVAAQSKDVNFVILMAGPGVNGEELLYEQAAMIQKAEGASKKAITQERKLRERLFSILKKESNVEIAEKKLRKVIEKHLKTMKEESKSAKTFHFINHENLDIMVNMLNTDWFRFFLTFNPMNFLKQVQVPVLALCGTHDVQVPADQNLTMIEKILTSSGNQQRKIVRLPKLNHFFQTCHTGLVEEYEQIDETISPTALNTISEWILDHKDLASNS